MLKKYYLVLMILFQITLLQGQKWDTIFGNPGTIESFRDLIECYDKGYLVSGYYEDLQANWLIKTDLNKNVLWEKFLTWDGIIVERSHVDQSSNGEYVLASVVSGSGVGLWPWITKLDSCGEKVWCRVFQDDEYNYGWFNDVLVLDNGDIIAVGELDSEEEIEKIFLWYIESDGHLKWRQGYASQNNYPHIRETNCDGIRKYGDNYIIHGDCYYPYPSDTTHFYQRPLFIMLDSLFNEQWIIPFGVNNSIIGKGYHTIELNDSIFIGVGVRRLPDDVRNSLLMFFSKEGEELGYEQIYNDDITQGLSSNFIHDIAKINDTLFMASSYFRYGNDPGQWGEMIIDYSGNINNYEMRSPSTSGWTSMIKTFDNKFTIGCSWEEGKTDWDIYMYKINEDLEQDTIYTGNYTYDSLCPYQIESGIIDITDCLLITDVGEVPTPGEYFASLNTIPIKAFPNPVNGNQITLQYQNTEHLTPPSIPPQGGKPPHLCIYNVFGEMVHEEKVYQFQGESKVNVGDWYAGMYIAIIFSKNKVVGKTKFVVQ